MELKIVGLDQYYGSAQALRAIDLTVAPGQCVAVLGRNGAGKTTLLKCMMGLLPIARGEILLDGGDIVRWAPYRRSRAGLAYVPQGREIFAELTVAENVLAAARAHGDMKGEGVDAAVAFFPVLRQVWRRAGGELSGGQQQQLALARALVTRPRILILDEPTEGVQPSIVKVIGEVIAKLKGEISIVLVEQYLDFAIELADGFVVLSRGSVVDAGTRADMSRERLSRFIVV